MIPAEQQAAIATLQAQLAALNQMVAASAARVVAMAEGYAATVPCCERHAVRKAVRNLRRIAGTPRPAPRLCWLPPASPDAASRREPKAAPRKTGAP